MRDKVILACKEHVDIAMDEIINNSETFPVMEVVEEGNCNYCGKLAKYAIK